MQCILLLRTAEFIEVRPLSNVFLTPPPREQEMSLRMKVSPSSFAHPQMSCVVAKIRGAKTSCNYFFAAADVAQQGFVSYEVFLPFTRIHA